MSVYATVKALVGQVRLYLALGQRILALACFLEAERLLPHIRGAQAYLNMTIQCQQLERHVFLPEV